MIFEGKAAVVSERASETPQFLQINRFAMAYSKYADNQCMIFDAANNTIIIDAIAS